VNRSPQGPRPTQGQRVWTRHLLPPDLAADLRHAREVKGVSLRVAAKAIGIDAGYLSRLERGLRAPRMSVAVRWARVLDLDEDVAEQLLDAAVVMRRLEG